MILIVAVFYQLVFLNVHCAPKSNHEPEIEHWWLSEAFIKWSSPEISTDHYTRELRLVRYDNAFCLDTLKDGNDEERKVLACFKAEELHAFLDNELYVVTRHSNRTIRMTLAEKDDAKKFKRFFEPTPLKHVSF